MTRVGTPEATRAMLEYHHLGLRQQLIETPDVTQTRETLESEHARGEAQLVTLQVLLEDVYPDPQCRYQAATEALRAMIAQAYPGDAEPARTSKIGQLAAAAGAENIAAIVRATQESDKATLDLLMPVYEAAWSNVSDTQLEAMKALADNVAATTLKPQNGGNYYINNQNLYANQVDAVVKEIRAGITKTIGDAAKMRSGLAAVDAGKALVTLKALSKRAFFEAKQSMEARSRHLLLVATETVASEFSAAITKLSDGDEGAATRLRASVEAQLERLEPMEAASGKIPERVTSLLTAICAVLDVLPAPPPPEDPPPEEVGKGEVQAT